MSGFRHIKNEIKRNLVRIPSHVWVMRLLDAQLKPFLVKKICVSSSKTTLRIIPRSHSKGWWQSLQQLGCSLPGTAASVTVVGLMNSYIYIRLNFQAYFGNWGRKTNFSCTNTPKRFIQPKNSMLPPGKGESFRMVQLNAAAHLWVDLKGPSQERPSHSGRFWALAKKSG